jgi:hypothetical protein
MQACLDMESGGHAPGDRGKLSPYSGQWYFHLLRVLRFRSNARSLSKELLDLVIFSMDFPMDDLVRRLLQGGDRTIFEREYRRAQGTAAVCEQLLLLRDPQVDLARWREGLFRLTGRRGASDKDRQFADAVTEIQSQDPFARFILNLLLTKRELELKDIQNGAKEFAADPRNRVVKRDLKYIATWCLLQGDFVPLLDNFFHMGFQGRITSALGAAAFRFHFAHLVTQILGPEGKGLLRLTALHLCDALFAQAMGCRAKWLKYVPMYWAASAFERLTFSARAHRPLLVLQPLLLGQLMQSECSDLTALTEEGQTLWKWLQDNAWDDAMPALRLEKDMLGELRRVEFARKPGSVRKAILEENARGIREMLAVKRDELKKEGELLAAMLEGALNLTKIDRCDLEELLLDYIEGNADIPEGPSA